MKAPPEWAVPPAPAGWRGLESGHEAWLALPRLPPLVRAEDAGPAEQHTAVRVCYTAAHLYVRFDCKDRDIWGTLHAHDDPLYDEEVVEVFLAPGGRTPSRYFEVEVSPLGTVLDARIHNPRGRAADLEVDLTWNPAHHITVTRDDAAGSWCALLELPWSAFGVAAPPGVARANFYRIERPRGAPAEFSAWSCPHTAPPDFHRPAQFGVLRFLSPSCSTAADQQARGAPPAPTPFPPQEENA